MLDPSLLEELAKAVDDADDRGDKLAFEQAIARLESINKSACEPIELAAINYYLANALSGLRKLDREDETRWNWSQPLLDREILHLRLAVSQLPDGTGGDVLRPRIITNLANALDATERFVEGLALWKKVLNIQADFGMALASKGNSYFWYAKYVRPESDQALVLRESHKCLFEALAAGVEEHAHASIESMFKHVSSMGDWGKFDVELAPYPAGTTDSEKQYRNWCRKEALFLSPLSDLDLSLGIEDIRDTLVLPSIVVPVSEGSAELPTVYGMFNQAKQEYTSARYLIYEAIQERTQDLHFADKGVTLYDALDYRLYRLWVERMKMAFLASYAILDKLAYLMNSYWKLGLKPTEVSFSGVWYVNGRRRNGIVSTFQGLRNWPLKGLYWLSKDFHHRPEEAGLVAPVPRMLQEIRNHIAHKYLRVHDHIVTHLRVDRTELSSDFSYQVTDDELQTYTVELLKLVRCSMIYLTAAVRQEELDKRSGIGDGLLASMQMFPVRDDCRL